MAELFLAKQLGMHDFEKIVAIKRILGHLAYDDEFINMFRDEARIVAKLHHPNIVQIYDYGKDDDTYFIAMEYIPGRNLSSIAKKARAKNEAIPCEYLARCVAQACEGLHYAHTRQDADGHPLEIVHRDVSPQNIIVSFSGTVKLVDFGIAKARTKIAHTRHGVLKGKYAYMSPEQIRGEQIDARSDLFAVGIVLYELLCGTRPFERDNSIQTLKAIVQDEPTDCRELNADIPDNLASIINKALTKDRDERFQTAQEVQVALEDFVSNSEQRCNNITISKWITGLFEEELSEDRGSTVVFKGIGEVILPEVEDKELELGEDELEAPDLGLFRGRGGGSVEGGPRPPIPAPSNSLIESLDRRLRAGGTPPPEAHVEDWEDDETMHMADKLKEDAFEPRGPDPDAPTEFGARRAEPEPEEPSGLLEYNQEFEFDTGEADPWDEATVGYREGEYPDWFPHEDKPAGDGADWDGATATGEAYSPDSKVKEPTLELAGRSEEDVERDRETAEAAIGVDDDLMELDSDDFSEADPAGQTIAAPSVDEDQTAAYAASDSPLAPAPPIEDDPEAPDIGKFDDAATLAYDSALFFEAHGQADDDEDDDDDEGGGWMGDATIAGAPPVFDDVSEEMPSISDQLEETVSAMDDEPSLPAAVDITKNVDLDDRTVAGVVSAEYEPPANLFKDSGAASVPENERPDPTDEIEDEEPPQERLGAIKLSKVSAVPTGGVREVANAKPDDRVDEHDPASSGKFEDFDFAFEEDDAPTEMPPALDEAELPSAMRSPLASEEYSKLVAPKELKPLNVRPSTGPAAGAFAIGSTNVPPADLSMEDMLASPVTAKRPIRTSAIRPASGRSPSLIGRQIREVVRSGSSATDSPVVRGTPDLPPPDVEAAPPDWPAEPAPAVQTAPVGPPPDWVNETAPPPSGVQMHQQPKPVAWILMAVVAVLVAALSVGVVVFKDQIFGPTEPNLTIETNPAGATVFVNGTPQSQPTPVVLNGLKPQTPYQVRLELDGYEPIGQRIELPPNQPVIWKVPLKRKAQ